MTFVAIQIQLGWFSNPVWGKSCKVEVNTINECQELANHTKDCFKYLKKRAKIKASGKAPSH